MSTGSAAAKLRDAEQRLARVWRRTRTAWQDDNARAFEERTLRPLTHRLRTTERVLGQLTALLQQMRRDCE